MNHGHDRSGEHTGAEQAAQQEPPDHATCDKPTDRRTRTEQRAGYSHLSSLAVSRGCGSALWKKKNNSECRQLRRLRSAFSSADMSRR